MEEEEEEDWNALLLLLLPPLRDPFQTNRKPTLDRRRNGAGLFFFSLLHALPLSAPGNYHGSAASLGRLDLRHWREFRQFTTFRWKNGTRRERGGEKGRGWKERRWIPSLLLPGNDND